MKLQTAALKALAGQMHAHRFEARLQIEGLAGVLREKCIFVEAYLANASGKAIWMLAHGLQFAVY